VGAECTVTSSRTAHFLSEPLPVSVLKFLQICGNLSNGPPLIRHTIRRAKALTLFLKENKVMQFVLLVFESPEALRHGTAPKRSLPRCLAGLLQVARRGRYLRWRRSTGSAGDRHHGASQGRKAARTRWPLRRYQGATGGIHNLNSPRLTQHSIGQRVPSSIGRAVEVRPSHLKPSAGSRNERKRSGGSHRRIEQVAASRTAVWWPTFPRTRATWPALRMPSATRW